MKNWEDYSEAEQLLIEISDAHKEAFGCRFSSTSLKEMTVQQLRDELARLQQIADDVLRHENLESIKYQRAVEEKITELVEIGAGNRETAIRWLQNGSEAADVEEFCWIMGMDFSLAPLYSVEDAGNQINWVYFNLPG